MMETGILADGSLSPRLKGDIYWKKQKLMFRSEAGGRKSRSHSDILIADLFVKYDEKRAKGREGRLSGDEFLEWPPTATGRDVSLNNISEVMIVRDRLRESGENELLYVILERVIALYFEKNGYEEETRQKIQLSTERREQIEAEYEETVRTYTEALTGAGGEEPAEDGSEDPDDGSEETSEYTAVILDPDGLQGYDQHIPVNYLSQIRDGSLKVTVYHNGDFAGLSITGVHNGWVEIVWISLPEEADKEQDAASLISFMIRSARREKKYKGVFLEMHQSEYTPGMAETLKAAGMRVYAEKNNNYEFVLSDVKRDPKVLEVARKIVCTPIGGLDQDTKGAIEAAIYCSDDPIPVSIPIPWVSFDEELSFAYCGGAQKIGLLLISRRADSLIIDLLHGSNPLIAAALLGSALTKLEQTAAPDQKFLVPIVVEASRPLLEKLVDGARRGDISEAVVRF